MKFDYVIGNPPYQESRDTTKDMPVYNDFMDAAYQVSEKVELITPGRFLFNAGATSKKWNEKMLLDTHFKVLKYERDSSKVFNNTDIKGGVVITYRDNTKDFGAIEIFSEYPELNNIRNKITKINNYCSLNTIMYPYSTYTLSENLWNDFPEKRAEVEYISKNRNKLSKQEKEGKLSNLRIITTNIFDLLPELFMDTKPNNEEEYVCLMGRHNNKRCNKYIKGRYIDVAKNYDRWKVLIAKSNGTGALGETLSTPIVCEPLIGYTQSFLGIGDFETKQEAINLYKYLCSKFVRCLLGILKITQDNPPEKWRYVPLQNFKDDSDINWQMSIHEINHQLYKKYNFTQEEIDFIETHIKEME